MPSNGYSVVKPNPTANDLYQIRDTTQGLPYGTTRQLVWFLQQKYREKRKSRKFHRLPGGFGTNLASITMQ